MSAPTPVPSKERWFEDFVVGELAEFGDYLVTEAEIIEFAKRYDPQPMHIDPVAAARGYHRGLIASGWMTAAIMMRLLVEHYLPIESAIASPGIDEIRWRHPVRPGDRLKMRVEVIGSRPSSKPDRGWVQVSEAAINQAGIVVMTRKGWGIYLRRAPLDVKPAR